MRTSIGIGMARCRAEARLAVAAADCRNDAKLPWRLILLVALFSVMAGWARGQDAEAGQRIFRAQCSICHSTQPERTIVGPSLFGVVGRQTGQAPGFQYSEANRRSGLKWDLPTLERYLTSPQQVIPGTRMTFPGIKDDRGRAAVIAYLTTLH